MPEFPFVSRRHVVHGAGCLLKTDYIRVQRLIITQYTVSLLCTNEH